MSLDVFLTLPVPRKAEPREVIIVREDGGMKEISREIWDASRPGVEPFVLTVDAEDSESTTVYRANITHNLTRMAHAAGIYEVLWRPGEVGITRAEQLIAPLTEGLAKLRADRKGFERFNSPNGWGLYVNFVPFVRDYLDACSRHPEALVSVSR